LSKGKKFAWRADMRDKSVLPGLIDTHVHLTSDRAGNEGMLAAVTDSTASFAYEAEMNARKTLNAGFTMVRNLGDSDDGISWRCADAVAKGWVQGPRIIDVTSSANATFGAAKNSSVLHSGKWS
jgi:imidazolonepropionase-like amidohydrolase